MRERKRNRLRGFDYTSDNLYFVTECVQDRDCCFGEIGTIQHETNHDNSTGDKVIGANHPEMVLNQYGLIAAQQWNWLAKQYPYVVLHAFVVMPNHIHGIIEINRASMGNDVGTGRDLSHIHYQTNLSDIIPPNDDPVAIGDGHDRDRDHHPPYDLLPKIKSLSELMGAYKTTVSKMIHLSGYTGFAWQRSFYDHIIRDENEFRTISDYIKNNPIKWDQDKFYK
ncbi:MAG: transposase [Marinilabiliales bacterium]|nr:transposase [Marinilabiliales bacterium]